MGPIMLLISGVVAKLISQEKRNSTYGYRTRSSETDEKTGNMHKN